MIIILNKNLSLNWMLFNTKTTDSKNTQFFFTYIVSIFILKKRVFSGVIFIRIEEYSNIFWRSGFDEWYLWPKDVISSSRIMNHQNRPLLYLFPTYWFNSMQHFILMSEIRYSKNIWIFFNTYEYNCKNRFWVWIWREVHCHCCEYG